MTDISLIASFDMSTQFGNVDASLALHLLGTKATVDKKK